MAPERAFARITRTTLRCDDSAPAPMPRFRVVISRRLSGDRVGRYWMGQIGCWRVDQKSSKISDLDGGRDRD
jgi:hypothetical protein